MQLRIRDDINPTADMVNQLEIMRKQIEDQLKAQKAEAPIVKALADLDKKMMDVELRLLSRTGPAQRRQVVRRGVQGVYESDVAVRRDRDRRGRRAGGADYRPTEASMEVLEEIEAALGKAKADFDAFMQKELPAFNKSMAGKIPPIGVSR